MYASSIRCVARITPTLALVTFALVIGAACAPAAGAQDNKKDDDSFSAGINLSAKADAKDVGLPLYPNSKPHKDKDDDSSSVNFGIFGGSLGVKFAVMKEETDATPEKVAEFYKKALRKYGTVLDCTNAPALTQEQKDANEKSNTLACDDDHAGKGGFVLKAGKHDDQHIVSVEAGAPATVYALVYMSTKGMSK
jgi:hypothetical protein